MRALIIDDRPDASQLALQLITPCVDVALTAQEAVAALLKPYDTVVLDLFLPGIEEFGGVMEFVHLVRRMHWKNLVIVSGCDPRLVQDAADEVDAVALPKPHLVADLLGACTRL